MICSKQTMLKVAAALGAATLIAYVALPTFRPWLITALPFLLLALCPLAMMFGTRPHDGVGQSPIKKEDATKPTKDKPT